MFCGVASIVRAFRSSGHKAHGGCITYVCILYMFMSIYSLILSYIDRKIILKIYTCVYIYNDHIGTTESRGHIECSRHTPHVRGGTKPAYSEQPH